MEIKVGKEFPFPQYVFSKPIYEQIPFFDFEGKNLEQIKQEYGKEVASAVYWSACHGNDVTKIQPPQCKRETVVEIAIREGMDVVEVYLKANTCTEAKEDMRVFTVKLQSPQVCKYTVRKMVTDFIDKLKEGRVHV